MENRNDTQEIISFLKADSELLNFATHNNSTESEKQIRFDTSFLDDLIQSLEQVNS